MYFKFNSLSDNFNLICILPIISQIRSVHTPCSKVSCSASIAISAPTFAFWYCNNVKLILIGVFSCGRKWLMYWWCTTYAMKYEWSLTNTCGVWVLELLTFDILTPLATDSTIYLPYIQQGGYIQMEKPT